MVGSKTLLSVVREQEHKLKEELATLWEFFRATIQELETQMVKKNEVLKRTMPR